ncbi:MAG: LamG domain-containing protein [Thermoleophilia bacterium]|nr:LamG domain-containing protein [Thermoleophilia bacterium]
MQGTANIQFADIRDSAAVTPLAATNSTAGPNNTNWTITGACATVTISGNSYEDAHGTVWSLCDGVTPNMALSVNGYGKVNTPCSPVDGSFSFTPVPDPGLIYLVYQDQNGTPLATGATYGLAPTPIASVTDVDVVYGEVRLRSDSGAPIRSSHLNMYDYDIDTTLGVKVLDGYDRLYLNDASDSASDDGELYIEAGTEFRPNHYVDATALDLRGTITNAGGTESLLNNQLAVHGSGTSTDCDDPIGTSMPICAGPAGGINAYDGSDQVVLDSTSPYAIAAMDYPSLRLTPSTGDNPAVQLGGSGNGTLRVRGELQLGSGGNDVAVDTSTYSPYVWVDGDTGQIGNLDISTDSSLAGTSDVRVDANMVGGGSIDMTGGTFENRIQTNDDAQDNVGPAGSGDHTYYNLTFSTSGFSRSPDFQSSSGTIRVRNDLQIGNPADSGTTTLVNNTINETIDVDGSVIITSRGSLSAASSPATPFTIGDDFTNQGTFTGNGGTVTFDTASNISTVTTSAPTTFSNLATTTPDKTLRLQHGMTTTVTGTFTANGGSCGSPVTIESTLAGSTATINMGTSGVQYATLRDSTASPGRTATSSANLGNNSGWTFAGGCSAPTSMLSHDTNASGLGIPQNPAILVDTPHFSWINNSGLTADRSRTQVVNTPVDADVVALWPNDGNGHDLAGSGGGDLVPAGAPNDASWDATSIQPGFGQSLVTDGDDAAIASSASSSLDIDTFTVEAWVRISSLTTGIGTESVLVTKDTSTTDRNFRLGVMRTAATTGVAWADISTGGAAGPAPLQGTTDLDDGQWHHVAYTVDSTPADPNKVQTLVVDGTVEATSTFSGNVDNPAVPVVVGAASTFTNGLDGRIDDVRISSAVRSPAEIKGYVRSRMPHGTVLWDSDPSNAGIALASCNNLARCADVIHGGVPVVRDGARYYVRGKLKSTTAIWSAWSTWDWFEAASGITINITSGASESLGTALPNTDLTATSDIDVWTNDRNGYTLLVKGPDDVWGMDGPGAATLPRFTAPPDSPASWPALTPGYFGFTVLAATGGKDTAVWGTGSTETSFATLNYVGLQQSRAAVAHRRNSYSLATDTITASYRADVAAAQAGGAYTTTIDYIVIANV